MIDYTTWKGIENRTGIDRENAYDFVLKELLVNAVDYFETQHISAAVAIDTQPSKHKKTEPHEKIIRIVVSNTNYYHDNISTPKNVSCRLILAICRFSSSLIIFSSNCITIDLTAK